jgi:hypothetical protein
MPTATVNPSPSVSSTPIPAQAPQQVINHSSVVVRSFLPDEEGIFRALVGQALVYEMMKKMATGLKSGEIDGMTGLVGLGVIGAMLQGIDPVLERPYVYPLLEHADVARAQQEKLRSIGTRWIDQHIDSTIALAELQEMDPNDSVIHYVDLLKTIGYSTEELSAELDRLQKDLQETLEQITLPGQ